MPPEEYVPIPVATLANGISQQPPHMRLSDQVESAQDFLFSVVDGASKRPGTWIERVLCSGLDLNHRHRLHPIVRDEIERYIVVYGQANFRVLEIGGDDANVTISAEAQAYLNSGSGDRLRLVTVADTTFVLNTTVVVRAITSESYLVTASYRDFDVLLSNTPATGTFHRADDDGIAANTAGHYEYDPDESSTFATWVGPTMTGSTWASPAGGYDDAGNNPGGFWIAFQSRNVDITGGAWTHATRRLVKAGAFAGYTLRSGDQIFVTGGTGVTAGWRAIALKVSDNEVELVSTTGFTADAADVTTDAIGREYVVQVQFNIGSFGDMYAIAAEFQKALRDAGAVDACVAWTFTAAQEGHFTITSTYRGSQAAVFNPTAPVTGFDYSAATRPFAAGTLVAGTGSPSTDTLPVLSRWTKIAAPNQSTAKIDPSTMPIVLRRVARSTETTPAEFDLDVAEWTPRLSGDELTNPAPKLFTEGITLSDLAFYRDRLALLGDTKIVTSRAGDLFNFFLEDALNAVDSDPIKRETAADDVCIGDFMIQTRNDLIIFAKSGRQFIFTSGEDPLTPASARLTPTSRYQTINGVRPVVIDRYVYFPTIANRAVQVWEYAYDELLVPGEAELITAHVPTLLELATETDRAQLLSLVVAPQNGMVLCLISTFSPTGDEKAGIDLFVYQSYRDEDTDKVLQSAWTQFVFSPSEPDDQMSVCDLAVIDDDLWLLTSALVDASREFYLERMSLRPERAQWDDPDEVHLCGGGGSPLSGGGKTPSAVGTQSFSATRRGIGAQQVGRKGGWHSRRPTNHRRN